MNHAKVCTCQFTGNYLTAQKKHVLNLAVFCAALGRLRR